MRMQNKHTASERATGDPKNSKLENSKTRKLEKTAHYHGGFLGRA